MTLQSDRPALTKALLKPYQGADLSSLTELQEQYISFGLSTNARGLDAIMKLEHFGISINNTNVLDVGCAYGGFSIEARRRGAKSVYGVDINSDLISLAKANLSDETEEFKKGCHFLTCDMTSDKALMELPQNYFDIIIVNDVFEHVYDTCRLMYILNALANPKCVLYFMIPNGLHFVDWVEKEPHHHWYGQSILEPDLWQEKGHRIYYRRWDYFEALFKHYGFGYIQFLNPQVKASKQKLTEDILVKFKKAETSLKEKFKDTSEEQFTREVLTALEKYNTELLRDLEEMNADKLHFKYLIDFWGGIAQKSTEKTYYDERLKLMTKQYGDLANSKLGRLQLAFWKFMGSL